MFVKCNCACHACEFYSTVLLLQSKLAESEDKVAAMAVQLEQLHADRLRLENRNSVLEKVTLRAVYMPSCTYVPVQSLSPSELQLNFKTHASSAVPHASSFTNLIQVLEMKEIEETKPSTSSSGRVLLITLCCYTSCYLYNTNRCILALPIHKHAV